MNGVSIRILPLQEFDTGALQGGATSVLYIARRIDTSRFQNAILTARLHAVSATWPNGATVTFECGVEGYTDEDPARIWTLPSPGGVGTLLTFLHTDTAPLVRTGSVAGALGYVPGSIFLRLKLMTAAGTPGTIRSVFSADLNLKGD